MSKTTSAHIFPLNYYYCKRQRKCIGYYGLVGKKRNGTFCLIGGMKDSIDRNKVDTAERETLEEIKISIKVDPSSENDCHGSSVFFMNGNGWSTTEINKLIREETRSGYQYHEIVEVDWMRIDDKISLMYNPGEESKISNFARTARNQSRKKIGL